MSHTGRSHVKETYACMYLQNLAKTKIGEKHNRSSRALLSMYTFLLYVSFHTRRALFISMQPDEDADQRSASGAAAPPQVVEFGHAVAVTAMCTSLLYVSFHTYRSLS